jgi:outer membrane protein, heavy metal efflux system
MKTNYLFGTLLMLVQIFAAGQGANTAQPVKVEALTAADLPAQESVRLALAQHPVVAAARDAARAQLSAGAALRAGVHEYTVRVDGGQRRDRLINQDFLEWGMTVERPLRWPDKVRLDEKLSIQNNEQAEIVIGDALHESGRQLLRLWFVWVRAAAVEQIWRDQVEVLRIQKDATVKRVRAGDAPRQENLLSQAALAQAEFTRQQASSRTQASLVELQANFPGIITPDRPVVLEPVALSKPLDYWREATMEHNHELRLAKAEVKRRQLIAARTEAEKRPDPSLGLRYSSERSNGDRILGLFVSVPIAGQARSFRAIEAQAQIDIAANREASLLRRIDGELNSNYALASAAWASASQAIEAAAGMRRNAELSSIGYELGEGLFQEVLTARRLAIEAELAATLARIDAAEWRYRLLLDAHELWDFD